MAKPKPNPVKPAEQYDDPVCDNCKWADHKHGVDMIICGVDLPPHVNTSADPRRHKCHKSYTCAFHSFRKDFADER